MKEEKKERSSSTTTVPEVSEGVRAALALYTQALDDGRTDDVVATFCPDGVCKNPGMGTHAGHEALRQAYTKWAPRRPQRHLVLNTVVETWGEDEATAVSDVVFILLGEDGWTWNSSAATTMCSTVTARSGDSITVRPRS